MLDQYEMTRLVHGVLNFQGGASWTSSDRQYAVSHTSALVVAHWGGEQRGPRKTRKVRACSRTLDIILEGLGEYY